MPSSFVPGEGRCLCVSEGARTDEGKASNDRAGLPCSGVAEAPGLRP